MPMLRHGQDFAVVGPKETLVECEHCYDKILSIMGIEKEKADHGIL